MQPKSQQAASSGDRKPYTISNQDKENEGLSSNISRNPHHTQDLSALAAIRRSKQPFRRAGNVDYNLLSAQSRLFMLQTSQELCKVVIVIMSQTGSPPAQGAAPASNLSADSSISAEAHLHARELNVHPLFISSEEWQDDDVEIDEDRGGVSNQQPNLQCYDELL